MTIQVRAISWIGFCKRVEHKKSGGTETKVLEVPFKVEGNKTKFLLKITQTKKKKELDRLYELFEVTAEYNGYIESFKQEVHRNKTTVLIDLICQEKKVKRQMRWFKAWF